MGVGIILKNHRDPMDKEVPGCLLAGLQRMNVRAHLLRGRKKNLILTTESGDVVIMRVLSLGE